MKTRTIQNTLRTLALCAVLALALVACTTSQSRFSPLGESYPPRPEAQPVEVFLGAGRPERPFLKVSRLDVHLEKTLYRSSSFFDALPELKKQARLSGADAIIELSEWTSMVGETDIYHVTGLGVRYSDPQ